MRYWRAFDKRHPLTAMFFLLFFVFSFAYAEDKGLLERIVAIVNDEAILHTELIERSDQLRRSIKKNEELKKIPVDATTDRKVLDQLINEVLISKEIQRRGLTATDSTIDGAVATVMRQNNIGSQREFARILRNEGLSLSEYRNTVKKQIEQSRLLTEVIRPRVQISDQDILAAHQNENQGKEKPSTRLRVQMLFLAKGKAENTREKIEKLREEIISQDSFGKVANRETEGPGKGEGGNIGEVSPKDLQPALATALKKLKKGEISPVIDAQNGYYVLKNVGEAQEVVDIPKDVRKKIEDRLVEAETARHFDEFVRSLREKAHIKVML